MMDAGTPQLQAAPSGAALKSRAAGADCARNPFASTGRTCISVSGGRTSGYMLWLVLQAHGGVLPADVVACFANTGKEEEATLLFVREMGLHWGVPVVWVEYRPDADGFALVDFATASRNGEPFEALIEKRKYLPNPVTRFCTVELKIRAMHKHLRSLGWHNGDEGWDQMIGIRADEPRRIAKIRARGHSTESSKESMLMPLAEAGVTVGEVGAFWSQQPFDLALATHNGRTLAGNCDLCFLKPAAQVQSLISQRPQRATWWARMESAVQSSGQAKGGGALFRTDRPSYSAMAQNTAKQVDAFGYLEGNESSCYCGD